MPTPQSGISNTQHEQLSNTSQMPGISRMPLGQMPGISQLALVRSGISQMPLLQSGISQMPAPRSGVTQAPLFQPLNSQMPLVQPGNSQMSTAQSGISKMPLMQQGINHLSLMQPSGSQLPVMHPGISQTPLVPLSGMPLRQPATTSMLMTKMSTMRPRSAQTSEMHKRNALHQPQTSSDDKFQMLQSHAHHISEPNAVNCWPLQPLQRTGKSHTTPELTSFEKWEKFDD